MRSPARSRTGLWLGVGVAAAAVLMVALSLVDGRERPRRGRATAAPEPIGHGAYHLREGVNHVEVEAPTLLETQAGVVELEPGKYEVRLGPDRVTVVVEKGRAVLRNARERHVVEAGGSGTLAEMSATAIAVESIARAEEGGGAEITGFVYDRDRQPVANARIWVSRGAARNDGEELGKTSEDGSFRVGGIGGAVRYVGARAAGWAPADLRRIEPAESPVFEMNFLLRHKGGALAVTVTDTDGSPVPGATVVAGGLYRDTPEKTKSPEGYPLVATGERTLVADAGGVARTDGMPPQWAKLRVLEKGLAPFQGRVRVSPEGVTRKDVILARGARVTGVVRVARAVAGGAQIMFLDVAGGRIVTPQSFWTRVDGSFEVEHAPLGKVRIVAVADDGAQASAWLDLEDGATLEWNATLSPAGSIEGKLVLESGAPLAQALVRCTPAWQQSRAPVSVRTEADGTFRFEKLAPERYRISVWYPGVQKARMQPPAKEVYVTLDEGPIRVELPDRDEELEPGFLAGTLLRGDGGVAAEAEVHAWPPDRPGSGLRARTAADGTFRLGPLAPGEYFMELHLDGEPTLHLDGFDVRTGETNDLGAVRFPRAGRIRGRILDRAGNPQPTWQISVRSLDGSIYYSVTKHEEGGVISEELAPGRYIVAGGATGLLKEAEVTGGDVVDVDLRLREGARVELAVQLENGETPPEVAYEFVDAAGQRVLLGTLNRGEPSLKVWLVSGTYKIRCQDAQDRKAVTEISITGDPQVIELPLTLR